MYDLVQMFLSVSFKILPLLLAMVLHEYAHGWVAAKCGDLTATREGRLTLNPLAHIDPFGTIIMPILCLILPGGVLFGWAKPVPINPRNMGRPRRDMALVAAAGPLMNLTLAIISGVILGLVLSIDPALTAQESRGTIEELERPLTGLFLFPLAVMAFYSILVNVLLGIFNLIPIPPLDGGRILVSLLPPGPALALIRLEPYGMLILVGLLVFDRELRVIHTITSTVASGISGTILSAAIGWSEGMSP